MPRKKKPPLIRYAGYDPTERNYGNTDAKSGPKPKAGENVGIKPPSKASRGLQEEGRIMLKQLIVRLIGAGEPFDSIFTVAIAAVGLTGIAVLFAVLVLIAIGVPTTKEKK